VDDHWQVFGPPVQLPLAQSLSMLQLCPFASLQLPAPSQTLLPLQTGASSVPPIATGMQEPGEALQVWHVELHAPLQQYPSTQ
jgi:hypothetical protein